MRTINKEIDAYMHGNKHVIIVTVMVNVCTLQTL